MAGLLLPLHAPDALRVAIIAENFLPKIDGSTITLAHLLQHMKSTGVRAMLFGPESGMTEYEGCRLFGTFGVPLRVYPGLKINFISPAFIRALRAFAPDVIHLVDPIWLGVQALAAIAVLFPGTPVVTSHHTNLPTYAAVFGYPYYHHRTWAVHAYLHSFARYTLVPSASTAGLLAQKGFANLRVCERGVDRGMFDPALRSPALRLAWGAAPTDTIILSVGRLSPEKNLALLVEAFALLPPAARAHAKLVFVGDGPWDGELRALCRERGVEAVFTGQLTGRELGEAFASADVMSSPSITETFGQVTLQGMASGLPVVGLHVEGTADLVAHGETGLLLDVHAAALAPSSNSTSPSFNSAPPAFFSSAMSSASSDTAFSDDEGDALLSPSDNGKGRATDTDEEEEWTPLTPLAPGTPVACFRSCAHLMRPGARALPSVAGRYARLLAALVAAPDLRRAMGARARKAAEGYEWERCTARMVATYAECAGRAECGAGLTRVRSGASDATRVGEDKEDAALAKDPESAALLKLREVHARPVVDACVVVHALVAATLSHASYMVPAPADLWGP
ncbi:hypothetical protein B0H17DRAFT_1197643 [Mycena rosella]|uniref:Glycosyltransferase family 4 protein n=1 Tax=Mycena rosella TaxID=1033263 RepID=A0AAD7DRE8_MYCRO|nr:hypothetical protein B0H17DRAFT_1197643 [Mycena rosella]